MSFSKYNRRFLQLGQMCFYFVSVTAVITTVRGGQALTVVKIPDHHNINDIKGIRGVQLLTD